MLLVVGENGFAKDAVSKKVQLLTLCKYTGNENSSSLWS
jgi:hypothetical protein